MAQAAREKAKAITLVSSLRPTFMKLSNAEFRRLHAQHIASEWWKVFRRQAIAHFGFRCAVCRDGYRKKYGEWQLIVDHKRYWKNDELIFGHETYNDVRTVCPDHNVKGTRSDTFFRQWRSSYRWLRVMTWIVMLPIRIGQWALAPSRGR